MLWFRLTAIQDLIISVFVTERVYLELKERGISNGI